MNELENKYNAIKAKLKPYKILTWVGTIVLVVGIVFMIINLIVKNDVTNILNYISLGLFGAVLILFLVLYFVYRNDLKELKKVKEEIIVEKRKH